jgi:hypothetical protein
MGEKVKDLILIKKDLENFDNKEVRVLEALIRKKPLVFSNQVLNIVDQEEV